MKPEIKYDLILNDIANEENITAQRVIEYARNRVLANLIECLEDTFLNSFLGEILAQMGITRTLSNEEALELLEKFIETENTREEIESILVKDYLHDSMDIKIAKEIIQYFDEEVKVSLGMLDFKVGKGYLFEVLELAVNTISEGASDEDDKPVLEYFGREFIGEHFVVIRPNDNDDALYSFVLDGATSNGYVMKCIYKEEV